MINNLRQEKPQGICPEFGKLEKDKNLWVLNQIYHKYQTGKCGVDIFEL